MQRLCQSSWQPWGKRAFNQRKGTLLSSQPVIVKQVALLFPEALERQEMFPSQFLRLSEMNEVS